MKVKWHWLFTVFIALIPFKGNSNENRWEDIREPSKSAPNAIGSYANGCLQGAYPLPLQGSGYQVVRSEKGRYFGHPDTISFIQRLGNFAEQDLGAVLLIADISLPQGGRFTYGHSSHQTGLDIDIWLRLSDRFLDVNELAQAKSVSVLNSKKAEIDDTQWKDKHFSLVKRAAFDEKVTRVFLHPLIKQKLCESETADKSWLRKVRPWWGHHSHMHVRLKCPEGNSSCIEQVQPPQGSGCGDELMSWITKPTSPKKRGEPPVMPAECAVMLDNKKAP
ncbi:penicillin-insensitive murein endopeptidase [Vibrio sp. T187]|uniref:penicillin-insensitive murein endopeptidase n=1 Tax=Vibrio TaxID=662 RepID=UPI0010CA12D3|nr:MULTISPECIES: penicillin-insensitive murein endopeptidase [Vibrio]MBW3697893.1 penicillin-insensitive murein endopeptidase [Vibrio sp. T187]